MVAELVRTSQEEASSSQAPQGAKGTAEPEKGKGKTGEKGAGKPTKGKPAKGAAQPAKGKEPAQGPGKKKNGRGGRSQAARATREARGAERREREGTDPVVLREGPGTDIPEPRTPEETPEGAGQVIQSPSSESSLDTAAVPKVPVFTGPAPGEDTPDFGGSDSEGEREAPPAAAAASSSSGAVPAKKEEPAERVAPPASAEAAAEPAEEAKPEASPKATPEAKPKALPKGAPAAKAPTVKAPPPHLGPPPPLNTSPADDGEQVETEESSSEGQGLSSTRQEMSQQPAYPPPQGDPVVEALRGEVATLRGLLESQAQQLQAAIGELAAQRQQTQGLAAAAAPAAPAPAPAQASGGGHLLKSMRLPAAFKGRDDWERFAFQAESYLAVVDTRYPAELEVARKCKVPLQMTAMTEMAQGVREVVVSYLQAKRVWTPSAGYAASSRRDPNAMDIGRIGDHGKEGKGKGDQKGKKGDKDHKKGKGDHDNKGKKGDKKGNQQGGRDGKERCPICWKTGHTVKECWFNAKGKGKGNKGQVAQVADDAATTLSTASLATAGPSASQAGGSTGGSGGKGQVRQVRDDRILGVRFAPPHDTEPEEEKILKVSGSLLVDSGARVSVCRPEAFPDLQPAGPPKSLYSVDNSRLKTKGRVQPSLLLGEERQSCKVNFEVTEDIEDEILSISRAVEAGAGIWLHREDSHILWPDGVRASILKRGSQFLLPYERELPPGSTNRVAPVAAEPPSPGRDLGHYEYIPEHDLEQAEQPDSRPRGVVREVRGGAREDPHRRREPADDPVTPLVTMDYQFYSRDGKEVEEEAHVAWLQARFGTKSTDGVTPYRAATGTDYGGALCSFGETVLAKLPRPGNKAQVRWVKGVWTGKLERDDSHVVLTEAGALNVRSVRRLSPETRHQTAAALKACGLPWNPRFGRAAPAERSEPMMVPIPLATPAEEVERREPPGERWLFHDGPRPDDEALLVEGAEQASRLPDASPTQDLANADIPDYEPSDVEAAPAAASAPPPQAASPAPAANDGSGEGGQKRDSAGSSASAAAAQQPPAAKSRTEPKKAPRLGALTEREVWQHIAALADAPLTNYQGERVEQARKEQLRKLWDRGAFTPVLRSEVPRGAQLFRAKWVDKCDKGRYKSRCTCADVKARYSPEQEAGMDIFVPTPTPESHSLLEVAALHNEGWVTRSLDIVAAFLIGRDRSAAEGCPVYMHAPVEWRELFDQWVLEQPTKDQQWYRDHFRDFVFRVDGNLYGRRTAGSVYRDELEEVLTGKLSKDYDFQRGVKDPCVFLDRRSGLILLHHIDDIRITVGELEEPGTAVEVLGRTKVRTEDSILTLPDSKHADNVCEQLGIGPKDKGVVPSKPLDLSRSEELSAGDSARFRSAVGSAIYLSADRRDIQFAVKELARRLQNPRICDWLAAETLARYLRATPRFGRVVVLDPASKSTALLNLEVYSDSDWAGCPETRRSTDNIVACLGGAVIQTSCQTQPGLPATSSGDAEIRGVSRAAREAVFLRELAEKDFALACGLPRLWADSAASIGALRAKLLELRKVKGTENPANFATKHAGTSPGCRTVLAKLPRPGNKAQVRWVKGVWTGKLERDDSHVVLTEAGALNVRSVRRLPPETRHQTAAALKACGLPWNPRFGRAAPAERSEPMMVPIPLATPAEEVERREPPGERWLFHDGPRPDDEALLVEGAEQASRLPDASPTEELAHADFYRTTNRQKGQKRDSAGSSTSAAAAQQPPAAKSRTEPKKAPRLGALTEREVWQHIAALADVPLTNYQGERDAWVGQVTDLLDRMLDPKQVEQARKEQLRKLWDRGAFTPVLRSEVPRGAQLFRAKWVDKCDKGRYKSRCTCADVKARYSPEQEAGMDVFVPTPTPESHSLLEVAALHNEGWVTRSLDIVAAFLIGRDRGAAEGCPVYMHAPVEWRELFDQWVLEQPTKDQQWYRDHFRDFVFRVDGNLYGRRTAGSVYRDELEEVLTGKLSKDYDFQRGVKDPCVFLDRRSGLILLHHIDDIRVAGPKAAVLKFTEVDLPAHCEITVGELEEFRSAVGSAIYLSADRRDIQFAVKELARRMQNPRICDWLAAETLARYLRATPRFGRVVVLDPASKSTALLNLEVYSDSDWAGCPETRRSTDNIVACLGGAVIQTSCQTQPGLPATSSGDAEIRGVSRAAREAVFLRELAEKDFALACGLPRLWADSAASIGAAKRIGPGSKLRHLEVAEFFVQGALRAKLLELRKVKGTENPANFATKHAKTGPEVRQSLPSMGMVDLDAVAGAAEALAQKGTIKTIQASPWKMSPPTKLPSSALMATIVALQVRPAKAQGHDFAELVLGFAALGFLAFLWMLWGLVSWLCRCRRERHEPEPEAEVEHHAERAEEPPRAAPRATEVWLRPEAPEEAQAEASNQAQAEAPNQAQAQGGGQQPRGAQEPEPEGERTPGPPPAAHVPPPPPPAAPRVRRRRRGPEPLSGDDEHLYETACGDRIHLFTNCNGLSSVPRDQILIGFRCHCAADPQNSEYLWTGFSFQVATGRVVRRYHGQQRGCPFMEGATMRHRVCLHCRNGHQSTKPGSAVNNSRLWVPPP
ncbi:unnamed protein product [Symbiodinium sp. CCMP2592]|nr:unnamed protein product [Symbiodinium sp. CCMP2592]